MSNFEPFDEKFEFDKSVLTEGFPDYMIASVKAWLIKTLRDQGALSGTYLSEDKFILPLNQAMRQTFSIPWHDFWNEMKKDIPTFRNILSYVLQNVARKPQGVALEKILSQTSSAYAVEIDTVLVNQQISQTNMKLVYRVPLIVKKQAENIFNDHALLAEAWESHYGVKPDDEKTVTRATDALAGLIRNRYFPDEKRPQLGTLLGKMRQKPEEYILPAQSLFDTDKFLELMKDFSKIRGNHQSGTGRKPTHEEAGFVLHFSIMLFQLLKK